MNEKIEVIRSKAVKMIICLAVFLLVVTALFNYFSYSLAKERLMESYAELRENEISELSFSVSQALDEPMKALLKRSMIDDVNEYKKELNSSLHVYIGGKNGIVKDVMYINESGMAEVLVPYSDDKLILNYSNEPFFTELKGGKTTFTRDYINNGKIELIIAVPVLLAKECDTSYCDFKGILVSTLDMGNIFDMVLGSLNSGKTPDYAAVLNSEGTMLSHINKSYIGKNYNDGVDKAKYPAAWDILNKSLKGGKGYGVHDFYSLKKGIYEQQSEVDKIIVYGPMGIKDLGWTMNIVLPFNELVSYSGISYLIYLALFNLFVAFIIIVSFVIFLTVALSHCRRCHKMDYTGYQRKKK